MMLLTSLSPASATAEEIVRLYRMRWQVELAFKRLKSLGGFATLQASDPRLARTWLLAHLIAVVLIEASLGEDLDSPLSCRPCQRHAGPARGAPGNRPIGACSRGSSPCHADAGASPPAAPREDGSPSLRANDPARQRGKNCIILAPMGPSPLSAPCQLQPHPSHSPSRRAPAPSRYRP